MEFPHLGKNCQHSYCNKLDFLPVKCDACGKMFCNEHFAYTSHSCPEAFRKDVQVPLCPLCGSPVPGKRGDAPDIAVSLHIDNDCQSDPAVERRKKVFTNKCSHKRCKTKEMVPLICADCRLNFCFRHRHAADHACEGKLAAKRRMAAEAAMARMAQTNNKNSPVISNQASIADVQGNMSEDEALARALALSMQQEQDASLEQQDAQLARALMNRQRVGGEQNNSRCEIS